MAYLTGNPKSKAEVKRNLKEGKVYRVYDPGIGLAKIPDNGTTFVEGPHYPKPHSWYGQVTLKDGVVVSIK